MPLTLAKIELSGSVPPQTAARQHGSLVNGRIPSPSPPITSSPGCAHSHRILEGFVPSYTLPVRLHPWRCNFGVGCLEFQVSPKLSRWQPIYKVSVREGHHLEPTCLGLHPQYQSKCGSVQTTTFDDLSHPHPPLILHVIPPDFSCVAAVWDSMGT